MIPEKCLKTPAGAHRELFFSPEQLRASAVSYFPHNFREVDGALVLTEGTEALEATRTDIAFLAEAGGMYAYVTTSNALRLTYRNGLTDLIYVDSAAMKRFIKQDIPEVGVMFIGVTPKNAVFARTRSVIPYSVPLSEGGACGAVYFERFFTAEGDTVRYSALHDPLDIKLRRDVSENPDSITETAQGAGYFQMHDSSLGDILDMAAYADRLYLFRERGITRLTGGADPTEFRLEDLCVEGYRPPLGESLVVCDGRILYFSADGKLCAFDGAKVKNIPDPAVAFIDFAKKLHAERGDGRYYCTVTREDNVKCVYCYDPIAGAGFFFATGVTAIGEELLHGYNMYISKFSGRGYVGENDKKSTLEAVFTPISDKSLLIESIVVEGAGNFTVKLFSEEEGRTFTALGGERVHLVTPLRVKKLTIRLESENDTAVCVTGICLIGTEVAYAD